MQRPELEQALEPAARLGVPGLAQADLDETRTAARVVRALPGSGRQVTDLVIARVVLLARSLGMPLGRERQWLADLGRAVWLHDQDFPAGRQVTEADVARGFGFLVGAAWVFYDAGWDKRTSLADLVRAAGGGAELTLAGRQAEYRLLLQDLGDDVPVSRRQLPELVDMPGDGPVNREQLAARVRRVIEAWTRPGGARGEPGRGGQDRGSPRRFGDPPAAQNRAGPVLTWSRAWAAPGAGRGGPPD